MARCKVYETVCVPRKVFLGVLSPRPRKHHFSLSQRMPNPLLLRFLPACFLSCLQQSENFQVLSGFGLLLRSECTVLRHIGVSTVTVRGCEQTGWIWCFWGAAEDQSVFCQSVIMGASDESIGFAHVSKISFENVHIS